MTPTIIFFDPQNKNWFQFKQPFKICSAHSIQEVLPLLANVEQLVEKGYAAAGFISYEAAPAFDKALKTRRLSGFPLCWFTVCKTTAPVELTAYPRKTYRMEEWVPTIEAARYRHDIRRIKAAIAAGETYQVNYTYRLLSAFRGDPFSFFLDLLENQQTDYAAYLDIGPTVVCSVSPELFFDLNGDRIYAKPMKGTAPRGRFLDEDLVRAEKLQRSLKNRAENIMIVDMIRNDLSRIAMTGTVAVDTLFDIERYPTALQMTSTVSARTEHSLTRIFRALFPCASITGAPKPRTMELIKLLETTPRKLYTGAIGFMLPGRSARFSVAIRTVLIDRRSGRAEYGVGGGIVWDSDANDELAESMTKARVLAERRPVFGLLETLRWTRDEGYFLLDYHLRRLKLSADYFNYPFDADEIKRRLNRMISGYTGKPRRVRLVVNPGGTISCRSAPFDPTSGSSIVKLKFSPVRVNSLNPLLYHKTTSRDFYQTARDQVENCDDVIFLNERNEITETAIYNIVIRRKGKLVTPATRCGLLPGTFRAWLLDRQEISQAVIRRRDCEEAS